MHSPEQRAAPARALSESLASTALAELLMELLEAEDTGTLLIYREGDALHAAVRIERGEPCAALAEDCAEHNLATLLLPLFAWSEGRFEFVAGQDLIGEHAVLRGRVDPLPLIAAAARGPLRAKWIDRTIARVERGLIRKSRRLEPNRYGFTLQEQLVVAALEPDLIELAELRRQAQVPEAMLRRVLYVLYVTRGLSLLPKQRAVSGTVQRSLPPHAEREPTARVRTGDPEQWTEHEIDGELPAARVASPRAHSTPTPAPRRNPTPTPSGSRISTPSRSPTPTPSRSPTPTPSRSPTPTPSRRPAPASVPYSQRPSRPSLAPGAEARARREQGEELWRKAEQLSKRGEVAAALEAARNAGKLYPPRAEHDALLGWLMLQHASGHKSVHAHVWRCLDRAAKRDPLCEQVLYYTGLVFNLLGDVEQAHTHFQRVLMFKPDHAEALREIRIYEMRKTHARSESSFLHRLLTGRPKAE